MRGSPRSSPSWTCWPRGSRRLTLRATFSAQLTDFKKGRPYLKVVWWSGKPFKQPFKRPYQTTKKAYQTTLKLRPAIVERLFKAI